jgi:hypothetical protein
MSGDMISWESLLYITVAILFITLAFDILMPPFLKEGFLVSAGSNPLLTAYFPRRGDISFDTEESGYVQDKRNVMGYADVQGLGVNHDFCRMVLRKGEDESRKFFACALAGTENLASMSYRTPSVKDGFKTSRDDYMRDADNDGKSDYCAITKVPGKSWEAQCYRALTTGFDTKTFIDVNPPEDIADVLEFYQGIMFWFRFIDDMKDYSQNLTLSVAGDIQLDETDVKPLPSQVMLGDNKTTNLDERVQITTGLKFNGSDQFVRLGDSPDMSFGTKIKLTTMRAMSMWVYCDEFKNNMHFIDFGNGAGIDNVFVGILGKGDGTMDMSGELRKDACSSIDLNKVVPDFPSGAQFVPTMSPMELMLTTSANVNDPPCEKPVLPRNLKPIPPPQGPKPTSGGSTATLLYEVWNGKLRMQHIKVQGAVKLKKWTHICITTASGDGVRPALQIWIDGEKRAEDSNAHLPQSSNTTNNYIGKSNWFSAASQYENRPEMFKGAIFDLRGYNQAINEKKLQKTIKWGKLRLGIK